MKTKDEIRDWLIENAMNERNEIDISNIDFGDRWFCAESVKAKGIINAEQKAKHIYNNHQEATTILNNGQEANVIYNHNQTRPYKHWSKEQLIKELEKRDNK